MTTKPTLTAKDLGLYLGCRVEYCEPEGVRLYGTLLGVQIDEEVTRVFIKPEHPEDEEYPSVIELEEEFMTPILRRLESMTEEERNELYNEYFGPSPAGHYVSFRKSKPQYRGRITYDDFLVIELHRLHPRAMRYLLSIGIDLFGWIDQGLAINRDTLTE